MQMQTMETISGKNLKRRLSIDLRDCEPKATEKAAMIPSSPSKPFSPISPIKKTKKPTSTKKKPDEKISSKPKMLKKKKMPEKIGDTVTNILKNDELVQRFRSVPMSNNQKGRIRQALKCQLLGSDNNISTDLISGKIQAIIKSAINLNDSDLRKIRILYNMLHTATKPKTVPSAEKKKKEPKKEPKIKKMEDGDNNKKENDTKSPKKKGPKRYVVFMGNLPLKITKERILQHFAEIGNNIKDIRIPKQEEKDKKRSTIAFMEVSNKAAYEAALSKHHSMLENRRINVLFTQQEKSKLTKTEAKGKAAKLVALQKAGKLAGSTVLTKKRSHRRNIMKRARAQEVAKENA